MAARYEAVTFEQLRAAKKVGARGRPAPRPELMAIANELAQKELEGTPITEQSVNSVATLYGAEFANSGGFRKRAREYAQAILAYTKDEAALRTAEAEAFAESVVCSDPQLQTGTRHEDAGPFNVGAVDEQPERVSEMPVQVGLKASVAEAAEAGEELDVEAKLAQLVLAPPPEDASGSQRSEQACADEMRGDEIDARAHIEAGAGRAPPINDPINAAKFNRDSKDELRRFWRVHGEGFSKWWRASSKDQRRQALLSFAPHMPKKSDKASLVPEMSLEWLLHDAAAGNDGASSSPTLEELKEFEALLGRDPDAACRVLNSRAATTTKYVMFRGRPIRDDRSSVHDVGESRPISISSSDALDLICGFGMSAERVFKMLESEQRQPPSSLTPASVTLPQQSRGFERNMKKFEGFLDTVDRLGATIVPEGMNPVMEYVGYSDGTFEAWYEGICRAVGLSVDSSGCCTTEYAARTYTDRWPPLPKGLLWLMEKRADSL